MKRSMIGLLAMFLIHATIAGVSWAQDAPPLVDLDATALTPGTAASWKNAGSLGGEFTANAESAPTIADVAGRRAVRFGDDHYLTSSFAAPGQLTGAKPFSVAVWAFVPEPVKRDVMVSWASRPLGTAEFGYGAGPDGAFFGWDKAARFEHVPPAGQWHHLAYTSAPGDFRVYVDGALDTKRELTISPKAGGHVLLGAGRNSVDQKPIAFFHGSLARVQIWDRCLSQRELRNAAGWTDPFNSTPADGAIIAAEDAVLHWEAGSAKATSFAVRIAQDRASAEADTNATPAKPANPEERSTKTELRPAEVKPGTIYFWRVDQFDAEGKLILKGPVWRFTIDNGPATGPVPRNRVAGASRTVRELRWTPGRYATSQTVYFGPDEQAVASGSAVLAKALPPSAAACPLPADPANALEYGKTYYWRVAEDNGAIPAAKGEVWAFRTEDQAIADDVTFFVGSDCHYGLGNNAELNRRVIDEMNWLPGTALPAKAGGGFVRTPRGVVLDGDLLDKGFDPKTAPANWAEFTRDYGLLGNDGRLGYPVYEGFGNHDGMTGKSISREGIRQRNKRRQGLAMVSANGFHYSWDWDQLHLVQLNLFPGKDSADCIVGPPNHDPEDALGFLKEDLAKNVGDSGRIVIVFCHYCYSGGMADWWTEAAKGRFRDAITHYRVILIHGHSHGAYFYTWRGIQAISDGATAKPEGQTGDFMVVHVTRDQLAVAERKLGGWGITLKVPLPGPLPAPAAAAVK